MPTTHLNPAEAGEQITRHDLHWGPTLGAATGPITFGYRQSTTTANSSVERNTFSQFTVQQMAATEAAMALWAAAANITFTLVNPGGTTNSATILFANYFSQTDGSQAYAYLPVTGNQASTSAQGDVWMNRAFESTTSIPYGSYDFLALLHEIGHALGLEHPGDYNAGPGQVIRYSTHAEYVEDSLQYSIMSYFDASNTGANHVFNGTMIFASTLLLHDIAAIQRLYGTNTTHATGNTVYGFNSNAAPAYLITGATHQVVFCIWDGGGVDTLDCSGYSTNQIISLIEGTFSSVGALTLNVSIAIGTVIENAIGGSGNDSITGNNADNLLYGKLGNDTITGGGGIDTVRFAGLRSTYTFTDLGGGVMRVSGPDGVDTLATVEFLQFDDVTIVFGDPDLQALNLQFDGSVVRYSVVNLGTGTAQSSVAAIYLSADTTVTTSDLLITTRSVAALASGGVASAAFGLTLPSTLAPGIYYLGVIADQTGVVPEASEGNNVSSVITVALGDAGANTVNGTSGSDRVLGLGGNDRLNGAAGADILLGGAGADVFVFDSVALNDARLSVPRFDRIVDYTLAAGDQVDLSALLQSAVLAGRPLSTLVRVIQDRLDGALLQVDVDGTANGLNWVTIARIDGIQNSEIVNVVVNASLPGGTNVTARDGVMPVIAGKFNGDNFADIVWFNDDGRVNLMTMNGAQITGDIPITVRAESIQAFADFNGDGKSDIVWRHSDGSINLMIMNGGQIVSEQRITNAPATWHLKAVGDFNGDGRPDFIWQNVNGPVNLMTLNGAQITGDQRITTATPDMHLVGTGDFNGDGKSDILWRTDSGAMKVMLLNGAQIIGEQQITNAPSTWHLRAVADFNGDGKVDLLFHNDSGALNVMTLNGTQITGDSRVTTLSPAEHIVSVGDYNGDGKADLLLRNDNGNVHLMTLNGAQILADTHITPTSPQWNPAGLDFDFV